MATIQIDTDFPQITPEQALTGWRREFCVELRGEGAARIFVRALEEGSFKAAELKRAILFQRLDARFGDLAGCVDFMRGDLDQLVDTARRTRPDQTNRFAIVEYDRATWERVQRGLNRWARS